MKAISPAEQATCENCGRDGLLTHETLSVDGKKAFVCHKCAGEIKREQGEIAPIVFGTTLEERRKALKEKEKEK